MPAKSVTSTLTARPAVVTRTATQRAAQRAAAELAQIDGDRQTPAPRVADTPLSKEGIVSRLFEAFSRRDLLGVLSYMHPDIVFQPMTAEVTRAGEPYRGHAGIRRYTEDIEAHWEELTVHPAQIRAAGSAVVVLGLASGRGPAGSFENAPTTWVVKFKDGLVFGVQIFSDARHVVGALVGDERT
jgi:ketosteroid isomerase-like protein